MSLENEIEQVNSGVEEQASHEPTQPATQDESESSSQELASKNEQKQPEPNVPFHEHPRFKELVEQKNKYADQLKAFEDRYKQLEERVNQQQPKAEEKQDKLISRLREIDPEFAERMELLSTRAEQASEYESRLQQIQEQAFAQNALAKINEMHSKNAVSKELQDRYNRELDNAYRNGELRDLKSVEAKYKSIHDDYSKLLDSYKRSALEQYTSSKKADAKAPASQPKGQPVPASKKFDWSRDPDVARKQMIDRVLKTAKASDNI